MEAMTHERPWQAEAQCAWMNHAGLVDAVITDDSDAFLFGALNVYRNVFESKKYVEAGLGFFVRPFVHSHIIHVKKAAFDSSLSISHHHLLTSYQHACTSIARLSRLNYLIVNNKTRKIE